MAKTKKICNRRTKGNCSLCVCLLKAGHVSPHRCKFGKFRNRIHKWRAK